MAYGGSVPVDAPPEPHQEQPQSQPQAPYQRHCPNMRSCWPLAEMLQSFNPLGTSEGPVIARRSAMIIILTLRTVGSILYLLSGIGFIDFIISTILAVIGFLCVAYFLHLTDRRCVRGGSVRCFGLWGPPHFAMWLYIAALIHVGIFACAFVGLPIIASRTLWVGLWILIVAIGWIASWEPEPESRSANIGV